LLKESKASKGWVNLPQKAFILAIFAPKLWQRKQHSFLSAERCGSIKIRQPILRLSQIQRHLPSICLATKRSGKTTDIYRTVDCLITPYSQLMIVHRGHLI
jgi:hypothetical protein